jgi:hypothetical protein
MPLFAVILWALERAFFGESKQSKSLLLGALQTKALENEPTFEFLFTLSFDWCLIVLLKTTRQQGSRQQGSSLARSWHVLLDPSHIKQLQIRQNRKSLLMTKYVSSFFAYCLFCSCLRGILHLGCFFLLFTYLSRIAKTKPSLQNPSC